VGGKSTAGKALKLTDGWYNSGNGTDSFGFSALPAGDRDISGRYDFEGYYAFFWSSTAHNSGYAYSMGLYYYDDFASMSNGCEDHGFGVRCLKD